MCLRRERDLGVGLHGLSEGSHLLKKRPFSGLGGLVAALLMGHEGVSAVLGFLGELVV